jgi:hypothetical protein
MATISLQFSPKVRQREGVGENTMTQSLEMVGESAWESNPPAALLRRHTGFEGRIWQFFQPLDIGSVFP